MIRQGGSDVGTVLSHRVFCFYLLVAISLAAGIAPLLQKNHGIYHERSFRSTRRSGCAEVVGVHVLSGAFDE